MSANLNTAVLSYTPKYATRILLLPKDAGRMEDNKDTTSEANFSTGRIILSKGRKDVPGEDSLLEETSQRQTNPTQIS